MTAAQLPEPTVRSDIGDLDSTWLSAALGREVTLISAEPVGTGQMGTCYRLRLDEADGTSTVLAKLPTLDQAGREMVAGIYQCEVRFYTVVAPTLDVRVPECFYGVALDSGDFTLLLEDLAPAEQGDQIAGCTPAQARAAVINLAGLHGPRWCDSTLTNIEGLKIQDQADADLLAEFYGPATDLFLANLGDAISEEDEQTLRACVDVAAAWALGRSERFGPIHGDYRLDNLLFAPEGNHDLDPVVAVDWQTLSLGLPARDLAFLLGTGLETDVRREHERDLVTAYHQALTTYGPVAAADYSFEDCWEDYRFAMMQGPMIAVFGCAFGTRSERGDTMFAAMVARSCAAMRDLGTLDLI